MDIRIRVDADPRGETVAALYRWLARDRQLARQAVLEPGSAEPAPGQMNGGVLDVINVVLSNGVALGSLITSIIAFRRSAQSANPPAPPVVVVLGHAGTTVEVTDGAEPDRIVAALAGQPTAGTGEHAR